MEKVPGTTNTVDVRVGRPIGRLIKQETFFEPRKVTGSELFSYLTCLHTTTFILMSTFLLVETISLKI